jgi:hypothetical protein
MQNRNVRVEDIEYHLWERKEVVDGRKDYPEHEGREEV